MSLTPITWIQTPVSQPAYSWILTGIGVSIVNTSIGFTMGRLYSKISWSKN